jgi:LacI family transcriptional regulator
MRRTPRKQQDSRAGTPRADIYAVAKRARVSTATVSRTINGASTVDSKLAARVWKAIRELDYQPKMQARALGSGRTRLIGLIVTDITNPFFPDLIRGFELAAVARGYEILIGSLDEEPENVARCVRRMTERSVDGIAALTFGIEQLILDQLAGRLLPLVFVDFDPSLPHVACLKMDYRRGMRQAVQHLAVLGHTNIGFLCGTLNAHVARERLDAFLAAMREIGAPINKDWICPGDFTLESGITAMERLLQQVKQPTAMICSNDISAIGMMHAVHNRRLEIPGDFSIIGFDNVHLAAYTYPPLTTVQMPCQELANAAVESLIGKIEGNERTGGREILTQLVVRQTTGVPRHAPAFLRVNSRHEKKK